MLHSYKYLRPAMKILIDTFENKFFNQNILSVIPFLENIFTEIGKFLCLQY